MEKVNWKVAGMTCTNCALSVEQYLKKKGLGQVRVNFATGDVAFELDDRFTKPELSKGIASLGYAVKADTPGTPVKRGYLYNHKQRVVFCFVFALPFFAHMMFSMPWFMNPWIQLALTLPVYFVGMRFFGKSAIASIARGIPNMNVLVALGATASLVYSVVGSMSGNISQYMFYETTVTIITLIFLGNWLEERSVKMTQAALQKLTVSQKIMANMIAFDDQHNENVFPVEAQHLHVGDLILIRSGEYVPMDCKVLWGQASVNESILTGESLPVEKTMNEKLVGGSILIEGTVKAYVTAVGDDTVMNHILKLVQDAQSEKPPVQQLADRISAVFVPVVLGLTVLCFALNLFAGHHPFSDSLMRSIAVLVIACPCAMGLATPAAIAVGLGRAAHHGVLFKNARSLEVFRDIRQVVFDKTGTLTTGRFSIQGFTVSGQISEAEFKRLVYSLEKFSTHPLAQSISTQWKTKEIRWQTVREVKGMGMTAVDKEGNSYKAGSDRFVEGIIPRGHTLYVSRNDELLGHIDLRDEIRKEAAPVMQYLRRHGIKTILLSGDKKVHCEAIAGALGMDEVIGEQTPVQKLEVITRLTAQQPTVMVGDGINDAPALAKATVGISLSDATQVAMQASQVVLINRGLTNLPLALGLGKHTYRTIRQNLFWAFFYNVVAIPVAAAGFLSPALAALVMGLSDVVLTLNSVRLKWKKVQ